MDFTGLRAWGEACGLETLALTTQRDFILRHVPARVSLLDPDGAGGAFKVLEQAVALTRGSIGGGG